MNETGMIVREKEQDHKDLKSLNLKQLFEEALNYGRIGLYNFDAGEFHFSIKFECSPGTTLEAKSQFKCPSIEEAIIQAIDNARKITESFK